MPYDMVLRGGRVIDPAQDVAAPMIATGARPKIAILREQGVNSQAEMAAAFERAGFAPYETEWWHFTFRRDARGPALDVPYAE